MGGLSLWHWLIVLAVVLLLFGGRGKISALMGDFGKGLKSFKEGLKGDEENGDQASSEGTKTLPKDSTTTAAPAEKNGTLKS
jgi:sec-independent protein translocase protein TatA